MRRLINTEDLTQISEEKSLSHYKATVGKDGSVSFAVYCSSNLLEITPCKYGIYST